jgi:nitrogen fixation NifU-like protein
MSRDLKALYQQMIIEHNKKPRNFHALDGATHDADGFNPLCGDHLHVYLTVNDDGIIEEAGFTGEGCAISKASASMMTTVLKGKTVADAERLFTQFQALVKGELKPEDPGHELGKLAVFSGVWQYPSRVKCAVLAWHAAHGALQREEEVTTE